MLKIRTAIESDIPHILDLYRQLTITTAPAEAGHDPTEDEYRQVFTQIKAVPNLELVVAEDNSKVVGSLVLMIVPNLSHKGLPWALVENVIVDEGQRRTGIGKFLIEYAIGRAKKTGCYHIGLSSDNRRNEAHKFYESLGFKGSAIGFRMSL
jgi:GNAT superfamily N-acetyltransferase